MEAILLISTLVTLGIVGFLVYHVNDNSKEAKKVNTSLNKNKEQIAKTSTVGKANFTKLTNEDRAIRSDLSWLDRKTNTIETAMRKEDANLANKVNASSVELKTLINNRTAQMQADMARTALAVQNEAANTYLTKTDYQSGSPLTDQVRTKKLTVHGPVDVVDGADNTMTTYGGSKTWPTARLTVGSGTDKTANNRGQVIVTDGNLHLDSGRNNGMYLNHYSAGQPIHANGPLITGPRGVGGPSWHPGWDMGRTGTIVHQDGQIRSRNNTENDWVHILYGREHRNIHMIHNQGYGMHINTRNNENQKYALETHNLDRPTFQIRNDGEMIQFRKDGRATHLDHWGTNYIRGWTAIDGHVGLADHHLRLRSLWDGNHGIGFRNEYGHERNINGSVVYGCQGGVLGTACDGERAALRWDQGGNVRVRGELSASAVRGASEVSANTIRAMGEVSGTAMNINGDAKVTNMSANNQVRSDVVQANRVCLGNTCLDEAELRTLKAATTAAPR